ncbi:zinc-binding alcohol dehydrogenase family protein [Agrilactobacillus fermenti]|uniref:zinc-binding alcohol dehydrogenase family protein n=1 Tax=Agrilactobacillus fermenti TaxID=2586909 RepID=UPI003A5B95C8
MHMTQIPTESLMIGFKSGFELNSGHFETQTLPLAPLKPKDVLVEIQAVSVNPVDTKRRQTLPATDQFQVLGYDAAGRILAVGDAVTDFKVGDAVFYAGTTRRRGADSQYQVVDSRLIALAPKQLTSAQQAALPLTALTAYELLFEKMNFVPQANANNGQRILVINGAGGVGSILTQLAKWSGLRVYATSSPRNFDWLMRNRTDVTLDYHQDLIEALKGVDITDMDGIAILYDPKAYFEVAAQLVRPFGHIGTIVAAADLPVGLIKNKAASLDWAYMFAKADYGYKIASQGQILAQISRLIDQGILKTTLTETFHDITPDTLYQAHQLIESGRVRGKLVLSGPVHK